MHNQDASPNVNNCVLVGNDVDVMGGGMLNEGVLANPTIVNCVFYDNTAWRGGAICDVTEGSHPMITNCTITENIALDAPGRPPGPRIGGGMYIGYASPTITNTILFGNHDEFDDESTINDEIYNYSGIANPSFSASDVNHCGGSGDGWNASVGYDGVYNIDTPPEFVDAMHPAGTVTPIVWMTADDGLRLQNTSPCIDKADGDFAPPKDILGVRRYDEGAAGGGVGQPPYVDIGAYEYHPLQVHFCGVVISDMYWYDKEWRKAFETDTVSSNIIFEADGYPDTASAIPQAVSQTLDSIAIRDGVKLTMWSGKNFTGDVLLKKKGPAVIYNLYWKEREEDYFRVAKNKVWADPLQDEFPQRVRKWSDTDMYVDPWGRQNYWWGYGSFKIE